MSYTPDTRRAPAASAALPNRTSRWLLWPVALTVTAVISVSFLLSFQAQTELATAARISPNVSFGWPVIVDGTIIIATFAALILQPFGARVSWYPWANLILFGILSIYANGIHATAAKPTTVELFIIGAVPAVGLLVSTHMLAILLTHRNAVPVAVAGVAETIPATKLAQPPAGYITSVNARPAVGRESAATPIPRIVAVETPADLTPISPPLAPDRKPTTAPLSREEVAAHVAEASAAGAPLTGADVGQLMKLSPARGQKILDQILAETEVAA